MRVVFLFSLVSLWIVQPLIALEFPNEDRIYDPKIKTVLLHKEGFEMASPIYMLGGEGLELSFDDLDVELKSYRFTIRHCTADWETTEGLMVTDYIAGVQEENIDRFDYSYNTTVEYIHYTAFIPSFSLKPRISGNYLLIVFIDDPEVPVFTRRFLVVEPTSAVVEARVVRADAPIQSYSKQQIDFVVDMQGFPFSNPEKEIKIVITQNDRWDNAIWNPRPRFSRGNELDFTFSPELTFNGGNEFRNVDIKSLSYQTENVRLINWDWQYNVFLLDDESRVRKPYLFVQDINGRLVIENDEYAEYSDVEADYAWVHFYLPSSTLIPGGKFYIMGALTDYRMAPPNEMVYDPKTRKYTCSLYLKQGYYDYIYVFKPNGADIGDAAFFEGSHWETENQYTIYVYLHPFSGLYDRLVAVQNVNSRDY